MKEISFRPGTSDHDLGHKVKKVREFLLEGERVKMVVKFRGREMAHLDKGIDTLARVLNYLGQSYKVVNDGKQDGRQYSIVITAK